MSSQLTDKELAELLPSELLPHPTPIPTQIVSSDEFYPDPQNDRQREVEARLLAMADDLGGKQGLDRRKFFQTTAGMAAAFVAMNEVYGPLFDVSKAEAATPAMAQERANALKDQFIMDMHTHFLRDDTRIMTFVNMRKAVGKAGWNKQLADKEQTIEDLKFENYKKEMFLDSDTKIALISSAPSDIEQDWFLTNEQMAAARDKVNKEAGSRRLLSHVIFTPGQPGWLEKLQAGLDLKPESCKGYTIGDNTHKEISRYPWRLDDEKVTYKGYELMVKAGIKNVCVHKGLFPPGVEKQFPNLRGFADVADVGQAAKDWPNLNFIIYHSAYRHVGGDPAVALAEFNRTGRIAWTSDLADIPQQYGVNNVYGDVGQLFATTLVAEPNVCAALMGTLIKGLGVDHVCWGTDALWTGSPQWQIEGLRRLEIPDDMQKKYGYAPLGPADGPVKTAIFGGNNARLYGIEPKRAMLELSADRFAALKAEYEK
ncbi:MAG: amidohydrolase family protein, partial [Xanthobacteraceae bacterium]|nr:amidohydrolase family protein [Xanthobacteraceae bacterium]